MVGGEGAVGNGDFAREVQAALGGDVAGSVGEVGGSSHHRETITHDTIPYLACQLSRVHNHDDH
jgi:hypothetical protein